ncbi:hypothetical protein [Streptomyces chryseus]|uniref:Uncharacterized protein n=1 Tax=Streptomyces chryseus TaxID=68186 RepID=A0ABQ3DE41_9ACTN|nr:hypothetical protein [Streptomyces chryseus]GHA83121.1 hypothetical protein GCM10010346_01810 [Streptomyces chryseus]
MAVRFTTMSHHCTGTVTSAIEAYSPRDGLAHGSLDATAYVCPAHVQTARAMWEGQGLTPYTAKAGRGSTRCGSLTDFREPPAKA